MLSRASYSVLRSLQKIRVPQRGCVSLTFVQQNKLLQALKEDDDRCKKALDSAAFIVFKDGSPLVEKHLPPSSSTESDPDQHRHWTLRRLVHSDLLSVVADEDAQMSLLSVSADGRPCFAISLPDATAIAEPLLLSGGKFMKARSALFLLSTSDANLMTKGYSVLEWSGTTLYCCNCGAELRTKTAGHAKHCTSCERVHYPVTAPVGITMVTDSAHTRTLLVRQARHPPGMFSCIAGFMEPGESVEACVRREVAEEVGLDVSHVRYSSSLHWPFQGGSMMMGCHAICDQTELDLDTAEIEDARWFSPTELLTAFQCTLQHAGNPRRLLETNSGPYVPPHGTIAHHLMRTWLLNRHLLLT